MTELEAEFERLGGEKAHQVRFLKSQQDLKAKMEEKQAAGDDGGEEEGDDGRLTLCLLFNSSIWFKQSFRFFFKIGGPKWPMEQKMVGHFLK